MWFGLSDGSVPGHVPWLRFLLYSIRQRKSNNREKGNPRSQRLQRCVWAGSPQISGWAPLPTLATRACDTGACGGPDLSKCGPAARRTLAPPSEESDGATPPASMSLHAGRLCGGRREQRKESEERPSNTNANTRTHTCKHTLGKRQSDRHGASCGMRPCGSTVITLRGARRHATIGQPARFGRGMREPSLRAGPTRAVAPRRGPPGFSSQVGMRLYKGTRQGTASHKLITLTITSKVCVQW